MAKSKQSREKDPDGPVGLGELLSFGTLFLGVVGVLALGAYLKTESLPAHPSAPPDGAVTVREQPEMARVEPAGEPAPGKTAAPSGLDRDRPARKSTLVRTPQVDSDLLRRTESDLQRLTGRGDPWTLQLALLCDPAGARDAVQRHGSHRALHVLPNLHEDRACFVLAWNRYRSREAAKAALDLPAELRSLYPRAFPKPIAEVLQ